MIPMKRTSDVSVCMRSNKPKNKKKQSRGLMDIKKIHGNLPFQDQVFHGCQAPLEKVIIKL